MNKKVQTEVKYEKTRIILVYESFAFMCTTTNKYIA